MTTPSATSPSDITRAELLDLAQEIADDDYAHGTATSSWEWLDDDERAAYISQARAVVAWFAKR